jgi:malate dehydrogenase (oxaloacetate-decarboxylating)(NADP+)
VALLSHSSSGQSDAASAKRMRRALALIRAHDPELEVDGEMHGDAALVPAIRARAVTASPLTETANLLVFPSLDAANIAFNLVKAVADGLVVGPLLLGMRKPLHVLVPSVTARGIANLTALAVHQAASGAAPGG